MQEEKLRLEAIHAELGKPLSSDPLVGPGYAHLPRGDSKYEQQSPYAETD